MKPDTKFPTGSKVRKTTLTLEARSVEPRELDEEIDDLDLPALSDDFELAPAAPATASPESRPNPVELPAPINPEGGRKQSVEMHRNLFCLQYDNCLDEAVKRGWNSFSCVRCSLYGVAKDQEIGGVTRFANQRRAS